MRDAREGGIGMIAIKGMTMPEHCGYCRFRYDGFCHALQKRTYTRTECPLVEIPDSVELCETRTEGRVLPEISAGGVIREERVCNET